MPVAMERALRRAGRKKGYKGKRLKHFIYGTMVSKTSWRPSRHKKSRRK